MSGPARPCAFCGHRPVARKSVRWCHACHPGGPQQPPPCRRCETVRDYYSAGLCSGCHQYAPQQLDGCRDCCAWGTSRTHRWLCSACRGWRTRHDEVGDCQVCDRHLTLVGGRCRLCHRHARWLRANGIDVGLKVARRGQQLFLADVGRRARHRTIPPATTPRRDRAPRGGGQLRLFDPGRPIPHPREPELLACGREHSERYGFSATHAKRLRVGLRRVLATDPTATSFLASRIVELTERDVPLAHTLAVLAAAGMLDDDRTEAIETWFVRHTVELPEPMLDELRVWFEVMRHGATTSPRTRPRSDTTTRIRLRWALPTLHAWAGAGHRTLREISRADIAAALPPSGNERVTLGLALRSIFGTLKARKVIFVNPMARTPLDAIERRTPLPLDLDQLRDALNSAEPARAVLAALLVFHGLRLAELRTLQLTDVRDGHVHLPGRTLPLAAPVRSRIADYLDLRNRRWPNTVNPHLFINMITAISAGPVGPRWVRLTLGMAPHAIRQDRILHEAIATGGDVRRLCDFFGITVAAALHYTTTLEHADLQHLDAPDPAGPPGS